MGMSIEKSKDILEDVVAYMASYGSAFPSEVYANQSYSEICNAIRTLEKLADKADYEARLKADMVAMLTEIQLGIEELDSRAGYSGGGMPTFSTDYIRKKKVNELVQQKINALKGGDDE